MRHKIKKKDAGTINPAKRKSFMTKAERKRKMWAEVGRITTKFPEIWSDWAMKMALYNIYTPDAPISDELLEKIIKRGKEIDFDKDARIVGNLQTHNSDTNYNNLKLLMGEELFKEMVKSPIEWGYVASMYDGFYRRSFGF